MLGACPARGEHESGARRHDFGIFVLIHSDVHKSFTMLSVNAVTVAVVALIVSSSVATNVTPLPSSSSSSSSSSAELANKNAEEARWLSATAKWGTLSYPASAVSGSNGSDDDVLSAEIMPFADDEDGHMYFYLMGEHTGRGVALTISEGSLHTNVFHQGGCGDTADPTYNKVVDVEDPRCAKLTLSGSIHPCDASQKRCQAGKDALFDRHPEMKSWPEDHHFAVHEFTVEDVWMIANYGGGAQMTAENYYDAEPVHHPAGRKRTPEPSMAAIVHGDFQGVPDYHDPAGHARWIVANSLWTTSECR